jgi:hypothetical protein
VGAIGRVFAGQKGNPYMYGAMPPFSYYPYLRDGGEFDGPKVVKAA